VKLLKSSNSQAGQESFVVEALNQKKGGFYIEVGAWHGVKDSNTLLLERQFGWSGLAFEIVPGFVRRYNRVRKNRCFKADATVLDFASLFEEQNVPKVVDYLQLDIEPGTHTLSALLKMPLESYRFSVITFEHDLYRSAENKYVKNWSEALLREHGYMRVVSNVLYDGKAFEDWWVDPSVVSQKFIDSNSANNTNWQDLFKG
jgi:hypothetical protein